MRDAGFAEAHALQRQFRQFRVVGAMVLMARLREGAAGKRHGEAGKRGSSQELPAVCDRRASVPAVTRFGV
jgi:hypothetical protein